MLQCFAYKYNKLLKRNRLLKTLLYKIENHNSSPFFKIATLIFYSGRTLYTLCVVYVYTKYIS